MSGKEGRSVFQDKFVYIYDTSGYVESNKDSKFLSPKHSLLL